MLLTAEFKIDFRCFKKGDRFEFVPGVNLLVGDQGTGKSSLLKLLSGSSVEVKRGDVLTCTTSAPITTKYFDCEKDNPRVKELPMTDNDGMYGFAIATHFASHGQAILPIIRHVEKEKEKTLFFIDEPDMAMSPKSIMLIKKMFDKAVKTGHQLVVSCHNPLLMLAYKEVIVMEERKVMNSREYLRSIVGKKFFD